jgi:hypothetical protein
MVPCVIMAFVTASVMSLIRAIPFEFSV